MSRKYFGTDIDDATGFRAAGERTHVGDEDGFAHVRSNKTTDIFATSTSSPEHTTVLCCFQISENL